ncbi:hypothetical protein B0T18DRAFT_67172 [Schizothecium vesticola]|uniref:Uncharacterized protein n=1 Tax=Schizothecium vesticola TaxID=314040 RepID=A0AA40F5D9_9PEZI|nr:hypothetical protein B0T18DRAFT_67172 [Schizothecium vesticola]
MYVKRQGEGRVERGKGRVLFGWGGARTDRGRRRLCLARWIGARTRGYLRRMDVEDTRGMGTGCGKGTLDFVWLNLSFSRGYHPLNINTTHCCTTALIHKPLFFPTDILSGQHLPAHPPPDPRQKTMRPSNIPPPPLARRSTDPLDAPPPIHHDPASESLWASEYASSNKVVVVGIDLGLAAILGIFLFVVWRQWRKGKKNRMAVDAEAAKGGRAGNVGSSSSSQQQQPAQLASGMEKDEVAVVVVAAALPEPEEIHKKGGK